MQTGQQFGPRRTLLYGGLVLGIGLFAAACGGGSNLVGGQNATANVTVSDPSTCTAPNGPFEHVYITITDVKASTDPNAQAGDSSFVDLTPGLSNAPMQIDLLSTAASQCFLATLGKTSSLPPGNYQQIRVILADNSTGATVSGNKCGSTAANCVVDANGNVSPLQLSSESKTGIKVPSGQIAGGQFTVSNGQTKTLNIDFNTCASIVQEGNGVYRLKPVLHAGEISTTSQSISGNVVDNATTQAIVGGTTTVALEQKDSTGVDRIVMETAADSSGNFSFCPLPGGNYDLVATAVNGAGTAYASTVILNIPVGTTLTNVPMKPVLTGTSGSLAMATLAGTVTTQNSSSQATSADLSVGALQSVTSSGSTVNITIPTVQTISTTSGASCAANTDCASYTINVPGTNPNIATYSSGGFTYTQDTTGSVQYSVDALAFVPSSGGTADCTPPEQTTSNNSSNASITVTPGSSVTVSTIAFTGCQ